MSTPKFFRNADIVESAASKFSTLLLLVLVMPSYAISRKNIHFQKYHVRTCRRNITFFILGVLEKSKKLSIVKIFVATFLPLVIIFACSVCCWKARQTAQTVGVGDNVLEKNTPEVMPKDSTSEKTASFHIQLEEKKGSISCEGEP